MSASAASRSSSRWRFSVGEAWETFQVPMRSTSQWLFRVFQVFRARGRRLKQTS